MSSSARDASPVRACYLGIDVGTQGLSVVCADASASDLCVLAVGEGSPYDMVPDLPDGCFEQRPGDWVEAVRVAMDGLRANLSERRGLKDGDWEVAAIGISGQMHGEVLADADGSALGPARLWCDSRNDAEGRELTKLFGFKVPKRATVARWLWTVRNRPGLAGRTRHITTPAGWIAHALTGGWDLGIGEASGMFPVDQATMDYDEEMLRKFDELVAGVALGEFEPPPTRDLLPRVRLAGDDAGSLSASGVALLGLPAAAIGVPVAGAEGDQVAALAGSLISDPGYVSCSFGTSVCANSVGDRAFEGVDRAVDHFCAADGRPINMVWLRNGTTYMNAVVEMFARVMESEEDGDARGRAFAAVIPQVLHAPPDCAGIIALPFMEDEPGLGVDRGGSASLAGLTPSNATPGNAVKAALLSAMFNLRLGSEVLDRQGYPRTHVVLSGGLAKTPELGQVLADVFNAPVTLLESAEEGTAWGAALMAAYRAERINGKTTSWSNFLALVKHGQSQSFNPQPDLVPQYEKTYQRYKRLVAQVPNITGAISGD